MTTELLAPSQPDRVVDLQIKTLMEKSYLDYAVSVITDRALPDIRDGLKPVHRRILFIMNEMKLRPNSPYVKSARVVGEVMGKLHPHGDSSIYDAAANMTQDWVKRVPLIDGQGNFGSVDGDNPAAMRYTEMRLTRAGHSFFDDINKDTVDFKPNYDGKEQEPQILPVPYPNIWINGVEGIAVGMATNILPHNLTETIDAMLMWLDDPIGTTVDEVLKVMPGPDFPTGGIVYDMGGYRDALLTGKGRVRVRSKYIVEKDKKGRTSLVITEIPFRVNKAKLLGAMIELWKNKVLEDVTAIRDETSKGQTRLVLDLKKGAYPEIIFNQILADTEASTSFSYNVMMLDGKRPKQYGIIEIFSRFIEFRREIVRRRCEFELKEARRSVYLTQGFIKALDTLDATLTTIRGAKNREEASTNLQVLLSIEIEQAAAILEMKLSRLTNLSISELRSEYEAKLLLIADLMDILATPSRINTIVRNELVEARDKFGAERRTEVSYENNDVSKADLVKKEPCLVHYTQNGYIKRMSLTDLNVQNRYTQGKSGIMTGDDDYVHAVYSGSTHDMVMLFQQNGNVRAKRAWQIPEGTPSQKGRHIRNLFEDMSEKIQTFLFVPSLEEPGVYLVTVTERGKIKRTSLAEYAGSLRRAGVQALTIEEGDKFLSAAICREHDHIMLGISDGRVVRFDVCDEQVRVMGRGAAGVRGVRMKEDATVLSMMVIAGDGEPRPRKMVPITRDVEGVPTVGETEIVDTEAMDSGLFLLCMGRNGVGKRTPVSEFAPQHRGGQGIMAFNTNKKTGPLVTMTLVREGENLILASQSKTNRVHVRDIRISGRITAGSFVMDTAGEPLMDVTSVPGTPDEDLADATLPE
jgi:DNA gyrase subunit A